MMFLFYFFPRSYVLIFAFSSTMGRLTKLHTVLKADHSPHLFMLLKRHNAAVIILPEWRPGQIIFESTQIQMGNFKEQP